MTTQDTKVDWGDGPVPIERLAGRIVPVEPTSRMIGEGMRAHMRALYDGKVAVNRGIEDATRAAAEIWTAMVRAAPDVSTPTDEVRERMEALVRRVADDKHETVPAWYVDLYDEARAIVALLEPVDEDLIEVRRIVAEGVRGPWPEKDIEHLLSGERDDSPSIQIPLACLKRGRALAEAGK